MTGGDDTKIRGRPGPKASSGTVVWTVLRTLAVATALVAGYYLLPLDRASAPAVATILTVGLVLFVALIVVQVRVIIRSPYPGLRGLEALATGVPFFLLLFAGSYVAMADLSADSFSIPLSHSDGLYFTVTVFSTVGFGDIVARSETARLVVTGQMIADLIVLGVAIKIVVGAVRQGLARRSPYAPPSG